MIHLTNKHLEQAPGLTRSLCPPHFSLLVERKQFLKLLPSSGSDESGRQKNWRDGRVKSLVQSGA
jgi:hypothetical protein